MDPRNVLARGQFDRVLFAIVTGVNPDQGTVSIIFNDLFGFRDDVPIPVIGMSADAWMRFIPQVNDVVHVGIRADESAVIIGWHPFKYENRTRAYNGDGSSAVGGEGPEFLAQLQPGEIDMRSKGGSYLKLDRIGDVLLMSLAGRIQMFGREGLMEVAQAATKLTDGQSTFRFGMPYRLFDNVSEREIPTMGSGFPQAGQVPLRERDERLIDTNGELIAQNSMGTVIDPQGILELSGTSGGGHAISLQKRLQKVATGLVGAKKLFSRAGLEEVRRFLSQQISNITDQVKAEAQRKTESVTSAIDPVISGAGSNSSLGDLADYTDDINSVIEGGGIHGDGINGIGARGRTLRHRMLAAKDGLQLAALDVDDGGGVVLSSQSSNGININANTGSITQYALKGLKNIATTITQLATNITLSAVSTFKLTCGTTLQLVANTLRLNGGTIVRTSDIATIDSSQGTITLQIVNSTGIPTGNTISITPGGIISVVSTGSVSVTSTGVVTITGSVINLN